MNKHILLIIDHQLNPGKYTKKQLRQNASEAAAIYAEYANNINVAADAAAPYANASNAAGAAAAYYVYAATNAATNADIEYWIDQYFLETKEDKQDYIDEINRGRQ